MCEESLPLVKECHGETSRGSGINIGKTWKFMEEHLTDMLLQRLAAAMQKGQCPWLHRHHSFEAWNTQGLDIWSLYLAGFTAALGHLASKPKAEKQGPAAFLVLRFLVPEHQQPSGTMQGVFPCAEKVPGTTMRLPLATCQGLPTSSVNIIAAQCSLVGGHRS